jgi:beta-N-acetylhexosaminidase
VKSIRSIRPGLLLCVDQEGGRVQRFKQGVSALPHLRSLGDKVDEGDSPEAERLSYRLGRLKALEMRALGLDLSFAPVLDLDRGISSVIGNRAFHRDPEVVISLASAYMKGMREAGMQAVGKHFPGHGGVSLDSHHALPIDERTLEDLAEDLRPFQFLSQQAMAGIMPAHIVFPKIDSLPVGFSKKWLTLLREQYGFRGTIVSDDLTMEGAAMMGDYPSRAKAALDAGCDFILICNNRDAVKNVLENLKFEDTPQIIRNRLNLLGKGVATPWEQLKETEEWLACASSPLELLHKTA